MNVYADRYGSPGSVVASLTGHADFYYAGASAHWDAKVGTEFMENSATLPVFADDVIYFEASGNPKAEIVIAYIRSATPDAIPARSKSRRPSSR